LSLHPHRDLSQLHEDYCVHTVLEHSRCMKTDVFTMLSNTLGA
jgi:hypothetical protein